MNLIDIQTKVVDIDYWNGINAALASLISIFLGFIVYFARDTAKTQKDIVKEIHGLAIDIQEMRDNGIAIKDDVKDIKDDVEKIKNEQRVHDNRITRLEAVK